MTVWRACQWRAAAQPSSITSIKGPLPLSRAEGLRSGWARPRMISRATISRSSSSHQGVRAGVSSGGKRPSNRRMAGKRTVRGAGGVTRSSHHNSGRPSSAARIQG